MKTIRKAAVIGGGVIGAGWAARFILNGIDVAVHDPSPAVAERMQAVLANATRAMARLTMIPLPPPGQLTFATSIEEAVKDAELIQESAPEREDLKRPLLAEIDRTAQPDALICSSSSGLLPTRLQAEMRHKERFLVAHPFNPVYLLPLVELCGGAATSPESIEKARVFYQSLGMRPLVVRKEIDGFIADRLLEALWREALWLVHDNVATVEEVDDAIRYGAGLRWGFMGTFLLYRLAGGTGGMRHFMAQFGPALQLPWTKLTEVPELTTEFLDQLEAQSDAQAAGIDLDQYERKRDDCLVATMQGLKAQNFGAGQVLARYEEELLSRAHAKPAQIDPAQPLRLYEGRVQADWIDYNNHMTESRYLQVFGNATDALLTYLGIDADYLNAGQSFFTVETHIMHLEEAAGLTPFYTTTQSLASDNKRLHIFHRLYNAESGALLATAEQMLLHVDTKLHRACPAQDHILNRVAELSAAHASLPRPAQAGRRIGDAPLSK